MVPRRERFTVTKRKILATERRARTPLPVESRTEQVLFCCSIASEEAVEKVRKAAASDFNEHGPTVVWPASSRRAEDEVVNFLDFVLMGLVTPFSEFFMAFLETYGIHAVHLHPNVMLDRKSVV